jgi:hypothetical protein
MDNLETPRGRNNSLDIHNFTNHLGIIIRLFNTHTDHSTLCHIPVDNVVGCVCYPDMGKYKNSVEHRVYFCDNSGFGYGILPDIPIKFCPAAFRTITKTNQKYINIQNIILLICLK